MTSPTSHRILDRDVAMPVEIRSARCFVAGFAADAEAIESMIDAGEHRRNPPLVPLRISKTRGLAMLVFVEYLDGDLGPYHEFGVCLLVADPAHASRRAAARALFAGDARALIAHLPVDGAFTLAAGRGIWGFPKTLADFDVDHTGRTRRGTVRADGKLIVDLSVAPGIPVPAATRDTTLHAYARLDGVLRATPWRLRSATGTTTRLGGARLRLGDHRIADDLRALRLSRHALLTSSVRQLAMTFDDAQIV